MEGDVMKIVRWICLLALGTLVASAAVAQTGSMVVVVVDGDGNPLPGANVTISHETSYVKTTTMVSDKRGIVEFPVLRPGPGYNIQVDFPGLGQIRQSDLRVTIGETLRVPVQMLDEIEEKVKVVATRDVVDLDNTAQQTRFSDDFIQDLPVPGRYYQNVLTMAPGVQDADGDGNPNVHGSRSRDFSTMVGGVRNVDPLTGQWMSNVNPNSIEEVEVITAGASVAYGRAQGGFANVIQKQGSNEHEGVFDLLLESSKLNGDGARDSQSQLPPPDFETIVPGFQISGPLVRDKLWYRFSHEYRHREDPIVTGKGTVVQTTVTGTHSDQVTWQVSPRNKLAFQFQADPYEQDNFGVSSFVDPASSQTRERSNNTYQLRWTAPYSPKVLVESQVSWQESSLEIFPTTVGAGNDCITNGPDALTGAQCTNLELGSVTGSDNADYEDRRQRFTLTSSATVFGPRFLGMSHQFRFDIAMENERYFRDLSLRPQMDYYIVDFPTEDPSGGGGNDIEKYGVAYLTVFTPVADDSRATGSNFALAVEDTMKPHQNVTLKLGLRVDREEINSEGLSPFDPQAQLAQVQAANTAGGTAPSSVWAPVFTGFEAQADFVNQMVNILCAGVDPSVYGNCRTTVLQQSFNQNANQLYNVRRRDDINLENTNFSPLVSVGWSPWSNGKTIFNASYRRYYNLLNLAIPTQELEPAASTLQYLVNLQDGTPQIDGRIQPTVAVSTIDRDLQTPYNDEISFEVERELWAETSLSLRYVQRKYRDQLQDRNINLATGDQGFCTVHRPGTGGSGIGSLPFWPSPGAGQAITDPYTGEIYYDTDPGSGDGRLDDCSGALEPVVIPESEGGGTGPGGDRSLVDRQVPDGVVDLYFQNPFWGDIYYLSNINSADYDGYVIELNRRQYRNWQMNFSYTWSKAVGDGEDYGNFFDDDPSLDDFVRGYQSYDQRHSVKLNAATITPWGIRLGTVTTWESGLPYSVLLNQRSQDVLPYATDSLVGDSVSRRQTYPTGSRNSERNESYWNIDIQATREFTLGRQLNLQVAAQVYNVLDDGRYLIYNPGAEAGQLVNGNAESYYEFGRSWELRAKLSF